MTTRIIADKRLLEFCKTEKQSEAVQAVIDTGSIKKAAQKLGRFDSSIQRSLSRARKEAAAQNVDPADEAEARTMEGFTVKRKSTLYDRRDGSTMLQWVIEEPSKVAQAEAFEEAIRDLIQDLPKAPVTKLKRKAKKLDPNLMNIIPFGDPHFGMLAWDDEVGDNFDLKIAEDDHTNAVRELMNRAPKAEHCVLISLGDYFHFDNMNGTTARSGHVLDADGRLPKVINSGIRCYINMIRLALETHKHVTAMVIQGNHDEVLANAMQVTLAFVFENDPRVTVPVNPAHRHYLEHGKVLIGVTHGHETKDPQLPIIMATEQGEAWGRTKFRYYYRGHHHHDEMKEYNGCTVEQFRTIAAGDSHAVHHGYLSHRDVKLITMHSDYGEVGRQVCSVEMLRDKY